MAEKTLREICEANARKGDGAFAIAAAIFDLSDSQEASAKALNRLDLGNASTPFGALENLTMELKNAGESLSQSLSEIAERVGNLASNLEK